MSYENKTPSCRAHLPRELFNRLIALLMKVEDINLEEVREKGPEIAEKLLKYSEPKDDIVDYRLYPSQILAVIWILVSHARPMEIDEDYYEILVRNRAKYEEWKNGKKGE